MQTLTRSISAEISPNAYAEGSILISIGNTRVLCTASLEDSVPGWLKGKGQGWLTAEYAMLPRATHTRTKRERDKVSGRTHEIQRLIGRSLRACVDLGQLGERTLHIDCDVIQADGGTRTTSITGAAVAVYAALKKTGLEKAWKGSVAAISVGKVNGKLVCDLDYLQDSNADVDMNLVMTEKLEFIEVQGTGEKSAFSPKELQELLALGESALKQIFEWQAARRKEF